MGAVGGSEIWSWGWQGSIRAQEQVPVCWPKPRAGGAVAVRVSLICSFFTHRSWESRIRAEDVNLGCRLQYCPQVPLEQCLWPCLHEDRRVADPWPLLSWTTSSHWENTAQCQVVAWDSWKRAHARPPTPTCAGRRWTGPWVWASGGRQLPGRECLGLEAAVVCSGPTCARGRARLRHCATRLAGCGQLGWDSGPGPCFRPLVTEAGGAQNSEAARVEGPECLQSFFLLEGSLVKLSCCGGSCVLVRGS